MKTIELSEGTFTDQTGMERLITTLQLIKNVLDSPPSNGFTMDDIRKRSRVDQAIPDKAERGYSLALEDSDYETLKQCVAAMRWGVRSDFILSFINSFGL